MVLQPPNEEFKPDVTTKILVPEINALKTVLKDTVIKTGQVIAFHAETRNLSVQTRPRTPPRTLTAALGRNIEKYDQLCDSIEAQLLRAISVLKRDLRREEARIEAEEKRKQTEALMLPPPVPVQNAESTSSDTPTTLPSGDEGGTHPRNSPILSARRPSAISISSLHRPQFPLKLDLSATSLRMTEEEGALFSKGLASPVTLAPKSARPTGSNEFPPDFMVSLGNDSTQLDPTHSNMDLTLSGDIESKPSLANLGVVGLGDSSDKPIELDLDGMDLDMSQFGSHIEGGENGGDGHDSLFSPMLDGEGVNNGPKDGNPLSTFDIDAADTDELFGDFASNSGLEETMTANESISQPHPNAMMSPHSLMAQFSSAQGLLDVKPSPSAHSMLPESGEAFDINSLDLSNFYPSGQDGEMNFAMDMDMASFLNMDPTSETKPDIEANK